MGGQERRVLAESLGMSERGHDVWIAATPGGALADRAAETGLEVIPMSFRRPLLPANAVALSSWTRRLQPDVVNSHSSADSWTAALARRLGPRVGALVRSRHISVRVKPSPRHRFLYGQADYVITTGESVRQELAGSGLVPLERSMSIPTGVDLERFHPDSADRAEARHALGVSQEGPVVGVVAYLRQDKGHAVLLEAFPKILRSYPKCTLVVVGDGPERLNLEALAERLGIGRSVRFAGLREDIPIVLAGFDVFCQPSLRNEGVPQSVLQAGAVARPVVSTEVGGIPEAVVHEETGFLVAPDDAGALADRIIALLADRELRRAMGQAARRHVSGAFSVQRMLDRTEQAYAAARLFAASRGAAGGSAP